MQSPQSILVPVNKSQASLDAIGTACLVAKPQRATVLALHVIEVLRALPLNSPLEEEALRGEQLLRQAETLAHHVDYNITGDLVQAREAGQTIVEEARGRGIDIIMMGMGYKRLVGEFEMGETADYVLRHADCQVWVVRQSLSPDSGPPPRR